VTGTRIVVIDTATVLLGRISAAAARALEPARGPLTDAVRAFFARRFASHGAYGGERWAPLAYATVLKRGREGYDAVLMERTGTLWASLTESGATGLTVRGHASSRAFGFAVLDPDGMALRVGSWDPVLSLTERGTRNMPARPVLPDEVPEEEVRGWAAVVLERMAEGW
jgi:hypothetical protein